MTSLSRSLTWLLHSSESGTWSTFRQQASSHGLLGHLGPMYRSSSLLMSSESQDSIWTPFVTLPMGTSSSGSPGQMSFQIERDTFPCSLLTPFLYFDDLRANTVMEKSPSGVFLPRSSS